MNRTKFNAFFEKRFSFKESFIFYLFFLFIYILPLIVNNVHYRDDYVRSLRGNDWDILGRKLTDLIMYIMSINFNSILNISPLNYIILIIFLSLSLAFFIHNTLIEKNVFSHLALSFLILSPFYIQNLSYQYDSLSMCLGICFVLIAYSLDWNKIKYFILSILLIALSASLFQPITNIFLAFLFSGFLLQLKDNEYSYKILFKGFSIYFISLVIYFLWFKFINPVASTDRGKIIVLNFDSIIFQVKLCLDLFFMITKPLIFSPFFIILSLMSLGAIAYIIKSLFKAHRWIIKLSIAVIPLALFISLWGPFILLDEAFSEARVYTSLGVIIFTIIMSFIKLIKDKNILLCISIGLITLNCFSLMYISSNLSKEEDKFNEQLSQSIAYDINSRSDLLQYKTVYINSFPPRSPNSNVVLNDIPFLQYINTPFNVWISRYVIESKGVKNIYKDINNMDDKYDWKAICENKTAKLVVSNKYYEIFSIKNERTVSKKHLSVWFKRRDNLCDDPPNIDFRKYYIKLAY